jgi:hypothetical protein
VILHFLLLNIRFVKFSSQCLATLPKLVSNSWV